MFEFREELKQSHIRDFLTVGAMGHSSQIAYGIALQKKHKNVFCLDGDGSVIMHMGSLTTNGFLGCENFKHIIINNGAHDSVGGQPTLGLNIDFIQIAKSCGYKNVYSCFSQNEIVKCVREMRNNKGPSLLEVK